MKEDNNKIPHAIWAAPLLTTLAFSALKLCGLVDMSWFMVLLPIVTLVCEGTLAILIALF